MRLILNLELRIVFRCQGPGVRERREILNPKLKIRSPTKTFEDRQIKITKIQRFKNGFRIECGMTNVGFIQFGGRFLHFAPHQLSLGYRLIGAGLNRKMVGSAHPTNRERAQEHKGEGDFQLSITNYG